MRTHGYGVVAGHDINRLGQAWQTQNAYGNHDTNYSHSDEALHAFRLWRAARYDDIER